jgi:hypothetical protein
VTWDDVLKSLSSRNENTGKTVGEFRMSPPRPPESDQSDQGTVSRGTPQGIHDLEEDLLLDSAEEEEFESESEEESNVVNVDSFLAREIVHPFEGDMLRTGN